MPPYLPDSAVLIPFTIAVIVLTLTPGPDMTLFLGKAVGQSRAAGLAAYAGTALGLMIHTVLVAVGLSALLVASVSAFTVLKIVGALYLLWLAVDALRRGSAFRVSDTGRGERLGRVFPAGLTVNLLNPKIIVFFLTFLPQFVNAVDPFAGAKLFALGVLYVVVATPFSVALIMGAGRIAGILARSPRATRVMDYVFAGVLGAFAVKLLSARAS